MSASLKYSKLFNKWKKILLQKKTHHFHTGNEYKTIYNENIIITVCLTKLLAISATNSHFVRTWVWYDWRRNNSEFKRAKKLHWYSFDSFARQPRCISSYSIIISKIKRDYNTQFSDMSWDIFYENDRIFFNLIDCTFCDISALLLIQDVHRFQIWLKISSQYYYLVLTEWGSYYIFSSTGAGMWEACLI